jgi:hypothetical protein
MDQAPTVQRARGRNGAAVAHVEARHAQQFVIADQHTGGSTFGAGSPVQFGLQRGECGPFGGGHRCFLRPKQGCLAAVDHSI